MFMFLLWQIWQNVPPPEEHRRQLVHPMIRMYTLIYALEDESAHGWSMGLLCLQSCGPLTYGVGTVIVLGRDAVFRTQDVVREHSHTSDFMV